MKRTFSAIGGLFYPGCNLMHDIVDILQHGIITETQNKEAQRFETGLALFIYFPPVVVTTSIYFDDELIGRAPKIHDVLIYRTLP